MTVKLPGIRMAAVATTILALALGVACGNDPGDATPTSPAKIGNATKPAAAPAHTEHAAEIDQQKMTFIPARVSIKVGETVLIKNSETAIHTGNINGKNITGNMKKGDNVPWTATAPGEYAVTCEYHPQMKATIVVTA
ncbi:MAG: cupredoxin domain-containing protein [Dehalococcoidia bacterium]|nr:cupredoxin domain-containing protein [Dehalococcoidia bacterium]